MNAPTALPFSCAQMTQPQPPACWAEWGLTADLLAARGLSLQVEATALVLAETGADGRAFLLTPQAAAAWQQLKANAERDGIVLVLESAFRSIDRQAELIREHLREGQPLGEILRLVAPPGCSEHHTGRAVDIATPGSAALEEDFEGTTAFAWLQAHAPAHGFTLSYPRDNSQGYAYEPWHWLYTADESGATPAPSASAVGRP